MTTRDHHIAGGAPNWSRPGNGFQPLTQHTGVDLRQSPMVQHRARAQAYRRRPPVWRKPLRVLLTLPQRLRAFWHACTRLPVNRQDRDAVMFARGQLYMIGVLGGVWLLVHCL